MRLHTLAAATAAILLAGCGSTSPASSTPAPLPTTSATPTEAPTAVSSSAPIPAALAQRWLGALPATLLPGQDRAVLDLTSGAKFTYDEPDAHYTSTAGQPGPGLLALESTGDGCAPGDAGVYAYTLSTGGTVLTLSLNHDPCSARAAVTPGRWLRSGCTDPGGNWCLGDLEAGSYASMFLAPRVPPNGDPNHGSHFGALTYTVPDGWANDHDTYHDYGLVARADYDRPDYYSSGSAGAIDVLVRPAAASQDANCDPVQQPGVARTVDAMVGWASHHPGVVAAPASAISIGSLTGQMVDLDIASSWKTSCAGFDGPVVELFTESPVGSTSGDLWWSGVGGAADSHDPIRFIFLDLGDGSTVLITIDTKDPAAEDAFVEAAMPIIQSFRFGPG